MGEYLQQKLQHMLNDSGCTSDVSPWPWRQILWPWPQRFGLGEKIQSQNLGRLQNSPLTSIDWSESQAAWQRQHCCNDDQQSQWENANFDPYRSETPKHIETKIGVSDYVIDPYNQGCTEFDFFKFGRSRIWPNFGTQIRPKPKPNLAETCFLVREQYASDKINGVNNAVSRYRGSTLQCFLCCITVCQLLTKFCILNYFSSILVFYLH